MSSIEFSLEEEELTKIRNNRTLLSKYKNVPLNEFWIHVEKMHAKIRKKTKSITEFFDVIFM
jgi:hypothetical protein